MEAKILPGKLNLTCYYLDSLSLTIIHLDEDSEIFDLTGKTITALIKENQNSKDTLLALSCIINITTGTVLITGSISSLIPNRKYYWDYRIDGVTKLSGSFTPSTKTGNVSGQVNLTLTGSTIIKLLINQTITQIVSGDSVVYKTVNTIAERNAVDGSVTPIVFVTEENTAYFWIGAAWR
jgi:hypothetical protein